MWSCLFYGNTFQAITGLANPGVGAHLEADECVKQETELKMSQQRSDTNIAEIL